MRNLIRVLVLVATLAGFIGISTMPNAAVNCEGCCGSMTLDMTPQEIAEWRSCMKGCQDAANAGVIYECAEK
jgi:hypothetical protein